jgi:hypothetical protein
MNPSYFRIRLPLPEAKQRLATWLGIASAPDLVATDCVNAVRLACTPQGIWRGRALFLYQKDDWSVFEDLTGGFSAHPGSTWLSFAHMDDLILAGYNDAIGCAELVVVTGGKVMREFSQDRENPGTDVNIGTLPSEATYPFQSWVDIAAFVDEDRLYGSDEGWLWLNESRVAG